jgi:hypothetical protein
MSVFERDEALAKVGKEVEVHDYIDPEDSDSGMIFSKEVPAGTTGRVIHANLQCRFAHPEYEPADHYEVVIEWDLPGRPADRLDKSAYQLFITELT